MTFKIFNNRQYLGEYNEEIFGENDLIAPGTVIPINNKNMCIENISLRKDGTVVIEAF